MTMAPTNQAAWLHKAGEPLQVGDAPMPTPGPGEIVVRNAAVAVNPLDWHMAKMGVFVQQWPAVFGCDVAGTVHEVGADVAAQRRFKVGDRVIGQATSFVTGLTKDAAFAHYTAIAADRAAVLPSDIPFTSGVVLPMAIGAAASALCTATPGVAMPGVSTPALGLPYPSFDGPVAADKALVVYGASSSAGSATTQLAAAMGITVVAVASAKSFPLCAAAGAAASFDYHDAAGLVDGVVGAVRESGRAFVGVFDAIATPETVAHDLAILERLGGGHLACSHPPPAEAVPDNVKAGMIFAVNDVATPLWKDWVTPALEKGVLKCLPPPTIVGKGLEFVQEGLEKSEAGVSGTKLVVEL